MWSLLLKETRLDASVPYFRQQSGDKCAWFGHIENTYARLSPRLKHYNVRFSSDLLTRYTLTTFDSKETLDELHADNWFNIRKIAYELYCQVNNIVVERVTLQHDSQEALDAYISSIVEITWPRSRVIVLDVRMPNRATHDRLMTNATKPEDDAWELHPWFLGCIGN